jgi:hypothetical protein
MAKQTKETTLNNHRERLLTEIHMFVAAAIYVADERVIRLDGDQVSLNAYGRLLTAMRNFEEAVAKVARDE